MSVKDWFLRSSRIALCLPPDLEIAVSPSVWRIAQYTLGAFTRDEGYIAGQRRAQRDVRIVLRHEFSSLNGCAGFIADDVEYIVHNLVVFQGKAARLRRVSGVQQVP